MPAPARLTANDFTKGSLCRWKYDHVPKRILMVTMTDAETGCGPVFTDPITREDVIRLTAADNYLTRVE